MPEIISVRASQRMAAAMSAEEPSKLEALSSCQECGAEAAWGIVEENVAYCEEHAPWVDRDLAAQVNRAVEPVALAAWLQQRPPTWRAKQETFGKEWTAENREELESWLRENRGDPVLVPYLEDAIGREDLRVDPPEVRTINYRPVTHLASWTERFNNMLTWWSVDDEGAEKDKVLEVLHKALELEELAAMGPAEAILAKGRESEVMPPEVMEAAMAAYREVERRSTRKGLLRRLLGGG